MLYPSVNDLLKYTGNRYSLTIATAKRARIIAAEAEITNEILLDKPVKIAINEIYSGKIKCTSKPQQDHTFNKYDFGK